MAAPTTRRQFVRLLVLGSGAYLLSACSSPPAPAASTAPAASGASAAKPTSPPAQAKPAAQAPAQAVEAKTIKFGHFGSKTHANQVFAEKFRDVLAERTGGKVEVQIFPDNQIGTEPQLAEGMLLGTVDAASVGSPMGQHVPVVQVHELPFMFRDRDHYHKALDGPIAAAITPAAQAKGFHFLGNAPIGIRQMTNNKRPINTPDDLKGLKMRVPDSKAFIEMMRALGASVVPIAFSELYLALQQNVVDGEENPFSTIKAQNYQEVQKYLSLTSHIYSSVMQWMSLKFYNDLSPDLRKIVDDAGRQADLAVRDWIVKNEQSDLDFLKTKMQVNTPPSLEPFMTATQGVADQLKANVPPELVKQIRELK